MPDPQSAETLLCSFCRKPRSAVARLISSPGDGPRAYICDECVRVCESILDEDAARVTPPEVSTTEPAEQHPLLTHPLVSPFLGAVERWIRQESLGGDAAAEFAEMRRLAGVLAGTASRPDSKRPRQ